MTPAVVIVQQQPVQVVQVTTPATPQVIQSGLSGPPGRQGEPGPIGEAADLTPYQLEVQSLEAGLDAKAEGSDLLAVAGSFADLLSAAMDSITRTYTQPFTASSVIVVTHNLGKYPSVLILDSAGTEWEGNVHYDSLDQLTVTLSVSFSGLVICN